MRRSLCALGLVLMPLVAFFGCSKDGESAGEATPEGGSSTESAPPDSSLVEVAPSCSADLLTDPKHCGRCGHDCLGGGCVAGSCRPVILAYDQGGPRTLILSGGFLYWLNSGTGTISRLPIAGGKPTKLVGDLDLISGNQTDFTVDATSLYVRDSSRLFAVPLGGAPDGSAPLAYDTQGYGASALPVIAVDDTWVYFSSGVGGVFAVPKDGSGVARKISATNIFFYSNSDQTLGPSMHQTSDAVLLSVPIHGAVYRVAKPSLDGGASDAAPPSPQTIAAQQAHPSGLAVNGGTVYWTNFASGSVRSAPATGLAVGAEPAQIASGQGGPRAVAVDQGIVYFTNSLTGIVASCPVGGCAGAPRVLVRELARPWGIAVDATSVYYTDEIGGTVSRIAK